MITKFVNWLNHFLSRFTYRKRFVFWAMIYFVATPYPLYVLLTSQNFFITRVNVHLKGTQYLKTLESLSYYLFLYQFKTQSHQFDKEWFNAQRSITNTIEQLDAVLKNQTKMPFGNFYGKNIYVNQTFDLSSLRQTWANILQNDLEQNADLFKKMRAEILAVNEAIALHYGMLLHADPLNQIIIESVFFDLPKMQGLAIDLYLQAQILVEQHPASKQLKAEYLAKLKIFHEYLQLLRTQINTIYHLLTRGGVLNLPFETDNPYENLENYRRLFEQYYDKLESSEILQEKDVDLKGVNGLAALALRSFKANQKAFSALLQIYEHRLAWQKEIIQWSQIFIVGSLLLGGAYIILFLILRPLTRHVWKLLEYIQELSKGDFGSSIRVNTGDELGQIVIAFNRMGDSVQKVLSRLQDLGKQATDFTKKVFKTAEEQQLTVNRQKKEIGQLEEIIGQISSNAKNLVSTIQTYTNSPQEIIFTNTSANGLELMQKNMTVLLDSSEHILKTLMAVHDKVGRTRTLMDFMTKVSDKAHLLSLNAAIETLNLGQYTQQFSDITVKIQRFAETTANSTNAIRNIISEMSHSVNKGKGTAESCLREINAGGNRLIVVSLQLGGIAQQGQKQLDKFQTVFEGLKEQATIAEEIETSIAQLHRMIEENAFSINKLQETIENLHETAKKLTRVLNSFFDRGDLKELS